MIVLRTLAAQLSGIPSVRQGASACPRARDSVLNYFSNRFETPCARLKCSTSAYMSRPRGVLNTLWSALGSVRYTFGCPGLMAFGTLCARRLTWEPSRTPRKVVETAAESMPSLREKQSKARALAEDFAKEFNQAPQPSPF